MFTPALNVDVLTSTFNPDILSLKAVSIFLLLAGRIPQAYPFATAIDRHEPATAQTELKQSSGYTALLSS